MTLPQLNLLPIFTTRGDVEAFLAYPYIFNRNGEWIGWVTRDREVYSLLGVYVGYLSNDPRILRKRALDESKPRLNPPSAPPRLRVPPTTPLPRMMSELGYDTIDVFEEMPELLHTADAGEFRPDLD
jgi:hypothetical protein